MMNNPTSTQANAVDPARYALHGLFYDRDRKAIFFVAQVRKTSAQFGNTVIVDMVSTDRTKKQQFTLDFFKDLLRCGAIQRTKLTSDGVGID